MKRSPGRKTSWPRAAAVLGIAAAAGALAAASRARAEDPPAPRAGDVFFREPDRETAKRIADLFTQFSADAVATRRRARTDLQAMGFWAVDPLIAALREREPPIRCASALTLEALGDRRALAPLRESVVREDSHPYVGAFAALALGRFRDDAAPAPLGCALGNPRQLDMLRAAAPLALARIRTPAALDVLRAQFDDLGAPEPVNAARLLALGFYPDVALAQGGERPGAILTDALGSRRRGERQAALLAFLVATSRTGAGREFLLEFAATDQPPQVTATALVGLAAFPGADVTDRICSVARGGGPDALREFAADLLVERADPASIPALLDLVRSQTSARLRASATLALGRFETDETNAAVIDRLRDKSPAVRSAAAVAAARSTSKALRDEMQARLTARLQAGENDARAREICTLAVQVLSGARRDVTWPEPGPEATFSTAFRSPRERLLRFVNRRAELSLDLGKITNLQTDDELTPPHVPGIAPEFDPRGGPLEGVPGETHGLPPSTGTAPQSPLGPIGAPRTSDWMELRDLLQALTDTPYFGEPDLPLPSAAPTAPGGR